MFKTIKDVRRRVVESVLEGVGAAERTVDDEFDMFVVKYQSMMQDLNECGAGVHSILTTQKTYFADAVELSKSLHRVHDQYSSSEYWPGTENHLQTETASIVYREKLQKVHDVYRSSCALLNVERGLEPLRENVAKLTPEIDGMIKERNTQLIDFDSYKRRLKGLREKQDNFEQHGKGATTAAQDNLNEIAKFENKEALAKDSYENKNSRTKEEIINAKALHDELITNLFVTTVVCQAELFSRAARELEEVISSLPPDRVEDARKKVYEVIGNGGIQLAPTEKSKTQKGFEIFTGKSVPSDFKKDTKEKSPTTSTSIPTAVPVSVTTTTNNIANRPPPPVVTAQVVKTTSTTNKSSTADPFVAGGNPFGKEDVSPSAPPASSPPTAVAPPSQRFSGAPPPPPSAAPPAPPAAAGKAKVTVEALYDHEVEAEDELPFKTGDFIEVIETSDDGWWTGRCHGREGLFPVNYVKTSANPF